MAEIVWVVILVFLVTAVQLAVYRYLGGRNDAAALEGHATDGPVRPAPGERGPGLEAPDATESHRCRACGTPNDPAFTFCRRCVTRLGA